MVEHPRVVVVSPTRQEFLGIAYFPARGGYYQRLGKSLHRTVWAHHHGPIPPAHHVHHVDHDRAHNQIENLELIAAADHVRRHTSTPEHAERARARLRLAQPIGAALQKTPENRAKHAAAKKAYWDARPYHTRTCVMCGAEYPSRSTRKPPYTYCDNTCRRKAQWRLKYWGSLHKTP